MLRRLLLEDGGHDAVEAAADALLALLLAEPAAFRSLGAYISTCSSNFPDSKTSRHWLWALHLLVLLPRSRPAHARPLNGHTCKICQEIQSPMRHMMLVVKTATG